MNVPLKTQLTNGPTEVGTHDLAPKDSQLLSQLTELWKDYSKRGLRVRWRTGELLNRRLGLPTKRLPHGRRVLKMAAEHLQTSESALSRMRWFAHLFESLLDFQEKHPNEDSWTKVKELLPPLIAAAKGRTRRVRRVACAGESSSATISTDKPVSGVEECDTGHLDGIWRSLDDVTEKLRGNGFRFDENARSRMLRAIQQLVAVLYDRHQIRFSIEQQRDS